MPTKGNITQRVVLMVGGIGDNAISTRVEKAALFQ